MRLGSADWKRLVIDGASQMKVHIDANQADLLAAHAETLARWSENMNLTTIRDPVEVAVKHCLDSLAPVGRIAPDAVVLDVGSGGGFPGIPLKIALPTLSITLIDASRKKVNFLKHVIRALGLKAIEAFQTRLEQFSAGTRFDVIVSRAFSDLTTFARGATPLLAAGGALIAFKARDLQADVAAFNRLSSEKGASGPDGICAISIDVDSYRLPVIDVARSLVIVRYGPRSEGDR